MKKQIVCLSKTIFLCFYFLVITGCSSLFESNLLKPTVSLKSQWAKNVSATTYIDVDGINVEFDMKGNIEKQEYKTNSVSIDNIRLIDVKRTYRLETAVNAYTAIFEVTELVDNTALPTNYFVGYMVDNGVILYRTAKAKNAVDLIELKSIGLNELTNLDDLENITLDDLENAKLKSMHMVGHKEAITKMSNIKMKDDNWTQLKNKLFAGEFIISLPAFDADGTPTPDPDDGERQLTNHYSSYVYLRAGEMGRIDVKYLVKTNVNGIIDGNIDIAAVKTNAIDFTTNPFINKNTTNNVTLSTTTIQAKLKNYLSTNHSMSYTTKDRYTTLISGVATLIYRIDDIELDYERYNYNYHKIEIIDNDTIKLIDSTYFVDIPSSKETPYYGIPKDIVLKNVGGFDPAP